MFCERDEMVRNNEGEANARNSKRNQERIAFIADILTTCAISVTLPSNKSQNDKCVYATGAQEKSKKQTLVFECKKKTFEVTQEYRKTRQQLSH